MQVQKQMEAVAKIHYVANSFSDLEKIATQQWLRCSGHRGMIEGQAIAVQEKKLLTHNYQANIMLNIMGSKFWLCDQYNKTIDNICQVFKSHTH